MNLFGSNATEDILKGLRAPTWKSGPYVLGVSPGHRLERAAQAIRALDAAQAVAEAAPDCRGVEPVGHVSVPVELMAEQQEAMWGKKR